VITRRQWMQYLAVVAGGLLSGTPVSAGGRSEAGSWRSEALSTPFIFAQVQYRGGDWDPHPSAAAELLKEVERRTSIAVSLQRHPLTLDDPDLFSFPFVYLTGALDFTPFTEEDTATWRRFLRYGGFLLIDDASGYRGSPFARRIRDEVRRMFPDQALERLPFDHAVFRSYYLVRTVAGRRLVSPSLEGVTLDD